MPARLDTLPLIVLAAARAAKATLNKSLAARSALFWAVCGLANPRHSWAMAVVVRLAAHPKPGRPHSRGLVQHCPNAAVPALRRLAFSPPAGFAVALVAARVVSVLLTLLLLTFLKSLVCGLRGRLGGAMTAA